MPRAGGSRRAAALGEDGLVCEHRERDRLLGVAVKAEILVCEHAHIRKRRGDIRHERAVPAAAPADDEPRGAHGAEIGDRRGDRLRRRPFGPRPQKARRRMRMRLLGLHEVR